MNKSTGPAWFIFPGMTILTLTYLVLGVAAIGLLVWRLKSHPTTYGSARWLPVWSAQANGLFRKGGLLVGDWSGLAPVSVGGSGHAITIAPTGAGKGTCAIIPNLLRRNFIFLLDPGGENTAVAIKAWRKKGFAVQVLNPWKMFPEEPWNLPAHSFNPLDGLDPDSPTFASDAALIAQMLVVRPAIDAGNGVFFKNEAESFLRAHIMHIVLTQPPEARNLVTLRRQIMAPFAEWQKLLAYMAANGACGGLIAGAGNNMLRRLMQAAEEYSGVHSSITECTEFLDDPIMQEALGSSSANFSVLKGLQNGAPVPGAVVSVVIPLTLLGKYAAYSRLALACAIRELQSGALAREQVLFVLDEFAAMQRMPLIINGVATLRKYNVCLWPIVQDVNQLAHIYGREWQTLISNATLRQWLATSDLETARYVSALCGLGTVETKTKSHDGRITRSEAGRTLITPGETMTMGRGQQIALIGNLSPVRLWMTPYWARPELQGLYNPNPYVKDPPAGLPLAAPLLALWGSLVKVIAWLVRPAPAVIYAAAIMLLLWIDPGLRVDGFWDPRDRSVVCVYRRVLERPEYLFRRLRTPEQCPGFSLGHSVWF